MPIWNSDIDDWIIEALKKNKKLGRNEIYNYVNKRYSLSKDAFDNHLKFLIQNNIVGRHDVGQRGTRIEHFLIDEANRKLLLGTLDPRELKNKNKKLIKITSHMKRKALYILILMFNYTTSFEFQNKEDAESFLAPLRLKIIRITDKSRIINKSESKEVNLDRKQFQTIFRSSDNSVTVFSNEYVNRFGGIFNVYNCQIRGMTKQSVILNRIDKPFQHLSFTLNQLDEAFELLCEDQILHPMPISDSEYIYRIIDNDVYTLLYSIEGLFTECVMPVMRKIWKYLRYPTSEERNWLTYVEGDIGANRIIIEDTEHRQKTMGVDMTGNLLRNKKIEKTKEIESQVRYLQDELDGNLKTYEFIINKYKSLQIIFEIMFPEFLQHLELRRSV